ncbi:hypothetical protein VDG1235_2560 [Verrucomicrobiia bacterium DG1235]|nr:hypothetical protein VDG1235_2560 [Verrucomicrobiae bacterium DG1235]
MLPFWWHRFFVEAALMTWFVDDAFFAHRSHRFTRIFGDGR